MSVVRKLFGKYLLITNTVSCGLMMGTGDIIQQYSEHWKKNYTSNYFSSRNTVCVLAASPEDERITKKPKQSGTVVLYSHDFSRTRNMATVGLVQGPFHHWFYTILERFSPGRSTLSVVKKTCLDQMIASPICLAIFFVGLGVLERHKLMEIYEEVRLKLYDTWKVDCCFWPPAQCVNFLFVPLHYRVLYTNFMTMVYDIFLSYIKYDAEYD